MKKKIRIFLLIAATLLLLYFVSFPPATNIEMEVVRSVDPSHFIESNLTKPIAKELRRLSNGTETMCYVISVKSIPVEHEMGPWAPKHITDGPEKGGIWFKDGHVYDVDGNFIAHLAEFYNDPKWNMVREDGSIKVTDTKEAFELAARPNVDPRYHNHCVECPPEVIEKLKNEETVFVIPIDPVYRSRSTSLGRGGIGLAFNGVNFDPPVPYQAIIGAHTIAPLDDFGGHANPHVGYHYHAATGHTKEIDQPDGHAPMIGYALDGFGIYAHLDEQGKPATELDECGGHYDSVRGYHYHVSAPGDNQILKAFRGIPGTMKTAEGH